METTVTNDAREYSTLLVMLLKGVIYHDADAVLWSGLLNQQKRIGDYFSHLGLDLTLDEAEGYAYLKSRPDSEDDNARIPRLIPRRQLSFPVSLLLALLRKKLAEFDASAGDTRLVMTSEEIVETVRVFMPETTNDARIVDQIDAHLKKIVDLGFLRPMKSGRGDRASVYEVRRILKAFVDAQWLSDFNARLSIYQAQLGEVSADA